MKNYLSFGMFALLFALTFGTVKPVQALEQSSLSKLLLDLNGC